MIVEYFLQKVLFISSAGTKKMKRVKRYQDGMHSGLNVNPPIKPKNEK
jgi:hypothetical protein